jgi:DNA-binding transcriptional MerR regulator
MSAGLVRFDDGKAPDALRTIGELSLALGIRQHVLRYWEDQFPQLQPLKRSGGRRYYRPEDIALVQTIDRLVHQEGYTLKGARMALGGKPGKGEAVPSPALTTSHQSGDVLRELTTIARDLRAALQAA